MIASTCIVTSVFIGVSLGASVPPAFDDRAPARTGSIADYIHHLNTTEDSLARTSPTADYIHHLDTTQSPEDSPATSENWSGAVLTGTGVTGVTGTFVVPDPIPPADADPLTQYCGTSWVGVDGDGAVCSGALMQAGVQWCVRQDEEPTFYAWQEWVPDEPSEVVFEDFEVAAGDEIRVTVNATDSTSGNALIENLSTGASAAHIWAGMDTALCEKTAEWITEDATLDGVYGRQLQPFANYGSVVFTNNYAFVGGQKVGVADAAPLDMVQNNVLVSQGSISDGEVITTYEL
ncbi:aspergillopepsin-2 precursor [Penicillium chermesinum]|nr:aspergillopepsin-2 precursor [Penicillium chermesinum]